MKHLIGSIALVVAGLPGLVLAADGFIAADVSLQAGPDSEYPSIDELPEGTPVSVQGCIDGWTWCDVIAGNDRGWVPGTFLEENYSGQWVYVTDYGPRLGLPVVSFTLGTYWGAHYHDRPWFAERDRWQARGIQPRMPTRAPGTAHAPERSGRGPAPGSQNATPHPTAGTPPNHAPGVPATQLRPAATVQNDPKPRPPVHAPPTNAPEHPARATPEQPPHSIPEQQARSPHPQAKTPPKPAKPENNGKGEPKEPAKKDVPEHREENNGH